MSDPTMDAVLSRLDALENQNRRLKQWGGAILVIWSAMSCVAMTQGVGAPKVVRAQKFEVVGEDGGVVAELSKGQLGAPLDQPYLLLKGRDEGTRALLSMTGSIPGLELQSPWWKVSAGPRRDIADPWASCGGLTVEAGDVLSGTRRLTLGVRSAGSPVVALCDKSGEQRVILEEVVKGTEQGRPPAGTDEYRIVVTTKDGKTLFKVPE